MAINWQQIHPNQINVGGTSYLLDVIEVYTVIYFNKDQEDDVSLSMEWAFWFEALPFVQLGIVV